MVSKKHFKAIAEILREHIKADLERAEPSNCEAIKLNSDKLINDFSNFFISENGLFSRERFREAILRADSEGEK